jgi:dTDP-4-dehydrorhamnose reductase
MRILLSGSTGILGCEILNQSKIKNWPCEIFDWKQAFFSSPKSLRELISQYDFFIHAAANTNVERCEADELSCFNDNFLTTEILAHASASANVPFVFISSVGVYGSGRNSPYREFDSVSPTTNHHKSKYCSEQVTLKASFKNIVIRTGWLFGGANDSPKNFIFQRIREAVQANKNKSAMYSNSEQRGVPCFNQDIAARILLIIESGYAGLFNCVNLGNASRFEYVKKILEITNIEVELLPVSGLEFNRMAQVSNNEMADNWKMDCLGFSKMPYWEDSLKKHINQIDIKDLLLN